MEKNVAESLVFPPSPQPSPILAETNVPGSKKPDDEQMVETGNSSENELDPTMEFPDDMQEREEFPKPVIFVVAAGKDIVNTILDFARDRDLSILVHHASGPISEVNISNPLYPSKDYTFQGNMHMFYLSGVYTKCLSPSPPKNVPFSFFNVQFSRGEVPHIYGGLVGHKLIAAEPVQVTASLFKEHEYYEYHELMSHHANDENVQPDTTTTTTNNNNNDNTGHHHGFFSRGASTSSSPMRALPFATAPPPLDFSKLYPNNQSNPGDNY